MEMHETMTMPPDPARLTQDLAALVAADSQNPPGNEQAAAELVAGWLRAIGCEVTLQSYAPTRTGVVARLTRGAGPVFCLNTHLDVVPAGEGWTSPPLQLTERDGRLYGRGACDAKGPLVAMVEAMRLLAADMEGWRGTVLGVFVADEEVASRGARHYAASAAAIDFALVGEPTGNAVVVAHKGSLRPLVRVHGQTAHSGTPDLGDNALFAAAKLLAMIEAEHRDVIRHRTHPLVGSASLTVTRAQGGVADNVVPDRCDLMLDRRMVPGEDEDAVKRDIAALLERARTAHGVTAEITGFQSTTGGASETDPAHPLVATCLAAARENGVAEPGPGGFTGGCDLVHFRGLGAAGAVIGPGALAVAHKPDEYVPLSELVQSAAIYRDVVRGMLPA